MYLRFGILTFWCLGLAVASETTELRGSLSAPIDVDEGDHHDRELAKNGGYQDQTKPIPDQLLGFDEEVLSIFKENGDLGLLNNGTQTKPKEKKGDDSDSDDDDVEYGASLIDPDLLARLQNKVTLEQLQYLILDVVHDAEENDEDPPEIDDVMLKISQEFGFTDDVMEAYVDNFPEVGKHIISAFVEATKRVRQKKIRGFVDLFLGTLLDDLRDGGDPLIVLKDLGLDEDDLDEALEALEDPVVQKKLEEAEDEGMERTIQRVDDAEKVGYNARRLGVRYEHDDTDFDEMAAEIDRKYEGRALKRDEMRKKMEAFREEIDDHSGLLEHHSRQLLAACEGKEGGEYLLCTASKITGAIGVAQNSNSALAVTFEPILNLFADMDKAEGHIKTIRKVAKQATTACKIVLYIPGIGEKFKDICPMLDSMEAPIRDVADKIMQFEDQVMEGWAAGMAKMQEVMSDVLPKLGASSGMAAFVTDVEGSKCMKDLIEMGGIDLEAFESRIGRVVSYVGVYEEQAKTFLKELAGEVWEKAEAEIQKLFEQLPSFDEFFKPFEPLSFMLDWEITIPWFKMPYKKKHLGSPACQPESQTGYKSKRWSKWIGNYCYEEPDNEWKTNIFSFNKGLVYRCEAGGMHGGLFGGCKNGNRGSKRAKFFRKCKSSTYRKYCWGTCYRSSCPANFKRNGCGALCNPNKRNKKRHKLSCAKYNKAGVKAKLGVLSIGGCYRQCNDGDIDALLGCLPPAKLTGSIRDIVDKFKGALNTIKKLPIRGIIEGAIDDSVGAVFAPITEGLPGWINASQGIAKPYFPGLNISAVPMGDIDEEMPGLPDPELEFAGKTLRSLAKDMDLPFDLASCGSDVGCLMERSGMGSIDKLIEELKGLLGVGELTQIAQAMKAVVPGLQCTKWVEKQVPISSVFKEVANKTCTSCDIKVPVCYEYKFQDMDALQGTMGNLTSVLEPVLARINAVRREAQRSRDLFSFSLPGIPHKDDIEDKTQGPNVDGTDFLTLISFPLSRTIMADAAVKNRPAIIADAWGHDDPKVFGTFISLLPTYSVRLGFNYKPGQTIEFEDLGFKIGSDTSIKISTTGSLNSLLQGRRQWLDEMRDVDVKKPDTVYGAGYDLCWNQRDQVENNDGIATYNARTNSGPDIQQLCKPLLKARDLILKKKRGCDRDDLNRWHDPYNDNTRAAGIKCVRHWWDVQQKVEDLIEHFNMKIKRRLATHRNRKRNKNNGSVDKVAKYMEKRFQSALNPLDFEIESGMLTQHLVGDVAQAIHGRFSVSMVKSPMEGLEPGFELEWDSGEDGVPKLAGMSAGRFSIRAIGDHMEEKEEMATWPQVQVKTEVDGQESIVSQDRKPEWVNSVTFGFHQDCQIDFFPNGGAVQGDMFWCKV